MLSVTKTDSHHATLCTFSTIWPTIFLPIRFRASDRIAPANFTFSTNSTTSLSHTAEDLIKTPPTWFRVGSRPWFGVLTVCKVEQMLLQSFKCKPLDLIKISVKSVMVIVDTR